MMASRTRAVKEAGTDVPVALGEKAIDEKATGEEAATDLGD